MMTTKNGQFHVSRCKFAFRNTMKSATAMVIRYATVWHHTNHSIRNGSSVRLPHSSSPQNKIISSLSVTDRMLSVLNISSAEMLERTYSRKAFKNWFSPIQNSNLSWMPR